MSQDTWALEYHSKFPEVFSRRSTTFGFFGVDVIACKGRL